ncbi:MAG: radical SAM protein [Candidatus Nealsonbacteria bacterium]
MTNILLINSWERDCGKKNFLSPPMGLWRIEAYLRNKLKDVMADVFDPNLYSDPHSKLSELLQDKKYDIIGFSPLHSTLENDLSLMFLCEEKSPASLFIAGGQEATFNHEFIFENFPKLDLIIAGEGEKPLVKLIGVIRENSVENIRKDYLLLGSVPGLYLRGAQKITAPNPALNYEEFREATMLTNYDRIPQKKYWDLICRYYTDEELQSEKLKKKIFVLKPFTSSYCPYKCAFCSSTNFQNFACGGAAKIASLTAEDMDIYLREMLKNQPETRTILFKDDNFFDRGNVDTVEIMKTLINLRKDYPLLCFAAKARTDTFIKKPELINLLSEANFFFLSYGVESFSKRELDYMNKHISPEDNRKVLRAINKAGIKSIIYIILSTPITEVADIFQTVEACLEFISNGNVVKLCPYIIPIRGSKLGEDRDIKDLIVYQDEKIPLSDKKVKIAKMILPRDKEARALILEFEATYPIKEKEYAEKLKITHITAEISTLMKFLTLYTIALNKKLIGEDKGREMISQIKAIFAKTCGVKLLIDEPTDL